LETVRVDICYRPLRIAWAIKSGDMEAFRAAARISFALWGGRFNPIVVVDNPKEAESLIDVFRVDVILPLGDTEQVKEFPKKFPHIITPFFHENIFVGDADYGVRSEVLDVHNALVHLQDKPEWEEVKERGLRLYTWAPNDPLADVFLMQLGEFPSPDEIHIDYRGFLKDVSEGKEVAINPASKLPADLFEHPSIAFISRYGLERHYSVPAGWDTPGFFSGDVSNFDDLVCCWNLRASDIPLLFVDVKHLERYGETVAARGKAMRDMVSHRRHEVRSEDCSLGPGRGPRQGRHGEGDDGSHKAIQRRGGVVSLHRWRRNVEWIEHPPTDDVSRRCFDPRSDRHRIRKAQGILFT